MATVRQDDERWFVIERDFPKPAVQATLTLLFSTQRWIWRRKEVVRLIDVATAQREVAFEFELPEDIPTLGTKKAPVHLVPLGFFRRGRTLGDFSIRDESGAAVPSLTARENALLTRQVFGLLRQGDEVLNAEEVVALTTRTPEEGSAVRKTVLERLPKGGPSDEAPRLLVQLVRDIAESFVLIAVVPADDRRRTLVVSYEERIERAAARLERPAKDGATATAGWFRPPRRRFDPQRLTDAVAAALDLTACHLAWHQWSVGDVVSSHVEIVAPPELEATAARMTVLDGDAKPRTFAADGVGPRASLYARDDQMEKVTVPWPRGGPTLVSVLLRPRGAGLFLAGCVTALVSAVALIVGSAYLERLVPARDGVAPLLVLVLTLAAAFLARPSEHAFASVLLRWPRLLIGLVGLLSFVAAAGLFAPKCAGSATTCEPQEWVKLTWLVGGVVSAIVAVALAAAWLWGRRAASPERQDDVRERQSRDLPCPRYLIKSSEGEREPTSEEPDRLVELADTYGLAHPR